MNFLAHATLAFREIDDDAAGLAAMAPDFRPARKVRLVPGAADDAVERGLAHHHLVDERFHADVAFHRLCRTVREGMSSEHGQHQRGALAHVVVELLLDGVIIRQAGGEATWERCWSGDSVERVLMLAAADDRSELLAEFERRRSNWAPDRYTTVAAASERSHAVVGRRRRIGRGLPPVGALVDAAEPAAAWLDERGLDWLATFDRTEVAPLS